MSDAESETGIASSDGKLRIPWTANVNGRMKKGELLDILQRIVEPVGVTIAALRFDDVAIGSVRVNRPCSFA
jgi:hypothetical protein